MAVTYCDSGCREDLPFPYSNACGVNPLPGGINRIGFITCDYAFTDITDQDEWDIVIAAGDGVWSGDLIGSKPKGTFAKKRVSSCSPERVTGGEKTIVFQDYNRSEVHGECSKFTFWNTFLTNPKAYHAVFLTCDGYLYGPIDNFTLEADEIIDEVSTGNRFVDGSIMWNKLEMECPVETDLVFDQDSSVI